jgi:hypothetical protein
MPKREGELAVSSLATIYGCCGLFDLCDDNDLMSLSFEGQSPFLDWIGWERTDVCRIRKGFITYTRAEDCSDGWLSNPCEDPNGVEYGVCEFQLEDFARLRRQGPVRDATEARMRLCERQPRYRLDGSPITDDREYDMRVAMEVIIQDLKRMIITGNVTTPGQFDGLQRLVRNGYVDPEGRDCSSMDSMIVDWNGNSMAALPAGSGATLNGKPIVAGYDFIDMLLWVYRQIRQRIRMAPALASQQMQVGDMVLVMPTFMTQCLLDTYTCWSVCSGSSIDTYEARTFRNNLNGGMFGAGRIFLDGFEIPLIAYDWELINGPTTADIYLLTGQVGNIKLIQGQYLDLTAAPQSYPEAGYWVTDGGRVLTWVERDHTCVKQIVEMRPRILSWAPWTNVRFQDVVCRGPGLPLSPDPCATSFFPETSFSAAACP